MRLQPLAPALPDREAGPRWGLAASALLHGLVVLAALSLTIRPKLPDGGVPPHYDFVFDNDPGGTPARTEQLPPPQPADITPPPDAMLGTPAPEPLSQPDLAATGTPPPAAESAPPPPPPQATAPPVPAPPLPAPPLPAPPLPSPPLPTPPLPAPPAPAVPPETPAEPVVRLQTPKLETAPKAAEAIMPEPPPPLPPVPSQPAPRQLSRPASRPAPRPRSAFGTLANPMDLSLAPSAPRPAARGSVASRAIDLSPPPERPGRLKSDPYAEIRAANASDDWNKGLLQYWLRHRYYPEQAAANGEQGDVTLQLTVNRSGKVESVEVISRSGSQWLDMAALGTWRNARLPPFTNEMREERITFPIPIRYYLTR